MTAAQKGSRTRWVNRLLAVSWVALLGAIVFAVFHATVFLTRGLL